MDENFSRRASGLMVPDSAKFGGIFHGTIIRGGYFDDDGVWHRGDKIIDDFVDHNIVVDEGLNHLLDVVFHASAQVTTWYLGVFEGNYTPVSTDTGANITANSTECTAYASSTRVAYVEAAAAAKVTTNAASRASFVFNATKTVYGAFLAQSSTKSGTTGVLMAASRFSASKAVDSGDELLLTYAFTGSSV